MPTSAIAARIALALSASAPGNFDRAVRVRSGGGPLRYSAACSAGALCRAYKNSSTAARAAV
jgi:hypothetical protein